jgi:hypothetical protein
MERPGGNRLGFLPKIDDCACSAGFLAEDRRLCLLGRQRLHKQSGRQGLEQNPPPRIV